MIYRWLSTTNKSNQLDALSVKAQHELSNMTANIHVIYLYVMITLSDIFCLHRVYQMWKEHLIADVSNFHGCITLALHSCRGNH